MAPLSFLKQERASSPPASSPQDKEKEKKQGGRLLRRKISLSARLGSASLDDPTDEPPTSASTSASFSEKQHEITELGRSLFGRQRRGSERPGWFSGGKKPEEGPNEEVATVILSSSSTTPTSRKITEDQNALADEGGSRWDDRPDTPPEVDAPVFPTALSPPRRKPVPSSPNLRNIASHELPQHLQSLSALGPPLPRPSSPASSSDGTGNAAWLARKPSLRSQREVSASTRAGLGSPSPITRKRAPRIPSTSSTGEAEDDSDVEIVRPMPGYEVEIVCQSNQTVNEMRWEVVIRPSKSPNSIPSHHPVLISPETSVTQIPPSASSLNMTLALDQPSGKLVFISLPTAANETPRRSRIADPPSTPPRTFASPASPMSSNTRRRGMYLPMKRDSNSTPPASPRDLFTPRANYLDLPMSGEMLRGESPNPDVMEHLRGD